MNKYILAFFLIIIIDLIFISFVLKPRFQKVVEKVQKQKLELNMTYALLSYLSIFSLFAYFVIYKKISSKEAFLLGFLSYAIFDFTNLAIFKDYDFKTGLIDMTWGGTLFFLVSYIIQMF